MSSPGVGRLKRLVVGRGYSTAWLSSAYAASMGIMQGLVRTLSEAAMAFKARSSCTGKASAGAKLKPAVRLSRGGSEGSRPGPGRIGGRSREFARTGAADLMTHGGRRSSA